MLEESESEILAANMKEEKEDGCGCDRSRVTPYTRYCYRTWLMLIPASECCLITEHSWDTTSTYESGNICKMLASIRLAGQEAILLAMLGCVVVMSSCV